MDFLIVEPGFQPRLGQLRLCNCTQIVQFFAGSETNFCKGTWIKQAELGPVGNPTLVFYKQYSFNKPSWRYIGRTSKARREWENYAVFQRLNVAAAQRLAYGEQRDWLGRLKRAFIITRAIPNAATLRDFVPKHCPNRTTTEFRLLRHQIVEQLARMTRRIHEAGFFHNDLYWRNILVQWNPGEAPKLWWIDCPRGKFARSPFVKFHRKIKDLAALDKSAEKLFTRRERIEFLKLYLGEKRLGTEARRLICDTLAYRKRRWALNAPG